MHRRPLVRSLPLCLLAFGLWLPSSVCAVEPPITALKYTPDGQSLVAASQRGLFLHVADAEPKSITVSEELKQIHAICFSGDGRKLAIGGGSPAESGLVEFLEWPSRKRIGLLDGFEDTVHGLAWSGDSSRLAAAGLDGSCRISDSELSSWKTKLVGHSKGVTALDFLNADSDLVSVGLDQSVRRWDSSTGQVLRTLNNHTRAVVSVATRPATEGLPLVATGSEDRTVRFWQPTIGRMIRFARLADRPVETVWSIDGTGVFAITRSGEICRIELDTAEVSWSESVLDGRAYSLALRPDGRQLAIGGFDGTIRLVTPPVNPVED